MKMKKKLIKNLNISNRNLYINFYSNYMIYNYLNNYNLKFFFLYISNKKYYLKNKKKILFFNKINIYNKYINLNKVFYFKNSNLPIVNLKNKFFNNFNNTNGFSFIQKKLLCFTDLNSNSNNTYFTDKKINYINLNNKNLLSNDLIYKELFFIIFLVNIIKLFEFYKIILNLVYLNIKI